MLFHSLTLGAAMASLQVSPMPPTPEQMAPRLAAIPRCVPSPAIARGATLGQPMSRADEIADGARRAAERFPILLCKEGTSK